VESKEGRTNGGNIIKTTFFQRGGEGGYINIIEKKKNG